MDEVKIKKPVFITILVVLVVVIGALAGFVIYDTIEIRNLKQNNAAFEEMTFPGGRDMRDGNKMNGEMPEDFNGEAPELPEGEMPTPDGGNVSGSDSSSSNSDSSSKPNRGSKSLSN